VMFLFFFITPLLLEETKGFMNIAVIKKETKDGGRTGLNQSHGALYKPSEYPHEESSRSL